MNNIGIAKVGRRDMVLGIFCLFLFSGLLYQGFVILGCEERAHVLHLG